MFLKNVLRWLSLDLSGHYALSSFPGNEGFASTGPMKSFPVKRLSSAVLRTQLRGCSPASPASGALLQGLFVAGHPCRGGAAAAGRLMVSLPSAGLGPR
ncbi:hypothetical protein AAY473_034781 [Plecturocebus cupreus]